MTIKTKSIYDPKSASDGLRILITRYYPRGVKRNRFDVWIRGASPTRELLKSYKLGKIDWGELKKQFSTQLQTEEESKAAIQQLIALARKKTITLLCYEKEGKNCHRQIVKAKLQRLL